MPVHEGHRSRKKEQFRAHGLDAFADHEVLELLLYYAVPRQDTNPIAHRLMQKFGSLDAVFAADRAALEEVEGVGENASTLLTLIFPLMRRIRASAGAHETVLSDTEQAGAYFLDLFFGEREEKLYEACLDAKGRLLACHLVAEGDTDSVQLNMRKIVENALKSGATTVGLYGVPSGGSYRISVVDNGRGIPEAELRRITEAFYMVDKSRSRKEHGAGLGLALSAKIAEIHHTHLEYASRPETGTMVTITLKMVEEDEEEG